MLRVAACSLCAALAAAAVLAAPPSAGEQAFDISVTVLNKREVMDKYAGSWFGWAADFVVSDEKFTQKLADKFVTLLPEKLQEAGIHASVTPRSTVGLTAVMSLQVSGYDLETLLTRAKGADFAAALLSLEPTLAKLGMPDKFAEIKAKIGDTVRVALMRKIPEVLVEKLGEQGVKASVKTDPEPPAESPAAPAELPPSREINFWVSIEDRETVAAAASGGFKGAVVRNLPSSKFLAVVREKLEKEVPAALEGKVGRALRLSISTEDDLDRGSGSKRESFWLRVHLDEVDVIELLRTAKGPDFAAAFADLLATLRKLQQLGVEQMEVAIDRIHNSVDAQILGQIQEKMKDAVAEKLGGTVRVVTVEEKEALRAFAARTPGRCCGRPSDGKVSSWWVAEELLTGGGLFGRSFLGRAGHCPKVDLEKGCAAAAGSSSGAVAQTHYQPAQDCFPAGATALPRVVAAACS